MSLRNNSLSFNYLLRALFGNKDLLCYDLSTVRETLGPDIKATLFLGASEPFIRPQDITTIEEQFGGKRAVVILGQGHVPWLDDPEGYAKALDEVLSPGA